MPNSVTEPARRRCAKPHQATAEICVFCAQAKSSSSLDVDGDHEQRIDVEAHLATAGKSANFAR